MIVRTIVAVAMLLLILFSFFIPKTIWFFVSLICASFVFILIAVKKNYTFNHNHLLSDQANKFAKRYWHYFMAPSASCDFSSGSAIIQFSLIPIVIVSCFNGFWWSIAYGIFGWGLMGFIAVEFSPAAAISSNPDFAAAHIEVSDLIQAKMREREQEQAEYEITVAQQAAESRTHQEGTP